MELDKKLKVWALYSYKYDAKSVRGPDEARVPTRTQKPVNELGAKPAFDRDSASAVVCLVKHRSTKN